MTCTCLQIQMLEYFVIIWLHRNNNSTTCIVITGCLSLGSWPLMWWDLWLTKYSVRCQFWGQFLYWEILLWTVWVWEKRRLCTIIMKTNLRSLFAWCSLGIKKCYLSSSMQVIEINRTAQSIWWLELLAGWPRNWRQIPGARDPFLHSIHTVWDPPGLLPSDHLGLFPGVEQMGCEADNSPPFCAEVKNV
jgi:hypothetical protein